MSIIDEVVQEIAKSGEKGITFEQIIDVQKKFGKSSTPEGACGAAGSMVSRLNRRRMIFTDRSVRPYRYKLSNSINTTEYVNGKAEGHAPNPPRRKPRRHVIPGGFSAALGRATRDFVASIETLIEIEVNRRVKNSVRDLWKRQISDLIEE